MCYKITFKHECLSYRNRLSPPGAGFSRCIKDLLVRAYDICSDFENIHSFICADFIFSFAPILYLLLIRFTGTLILVHVLYYIIPLVNSCYKCCSFMLILIHIVLELCCNMMDILHTETSRGVNSLIIEGHTYRKVSVLKNNIS